MTEVEKRCAQIFARELNVDVADINASSDPETLEEWDSLSHVQLILALEKEFNISIPPDESVELEDFGSVTKLIEEKLKIEKDDA